MGSQAAGLPIRNGWRGAAGMQRTGLHISAAVLLASVVLLSGGQATAGAPPASALPTLPLPSQDPLRIDFGSDPILRLNESSVPVEEFRAVVAGAVARHPAKLEALAFDEEARAALSEARQQLYPAGDLTITSFKILDREFSNDPENILERSRPANRTDALIKIQQTVYDFGATSRRIEAAGARLRAAAAELESTVD